MRLRAVRLNSVSYPVEPDEQAMFDGIGAEFVGLEGQSSDEILSVAGDCDALLVVSSRISATVIRGLTRCRVISRLGAGTDRIDVAAATECGIVVANVPEFCVNEQAEHALALLLAWARRLPFMLDSMRQGNWTARNHPGVRRLAGQTLGLIGFGSSAQAVATRAKAFGLNIIAWARDPKKYRETAQQLGVELKSLEWTLALSDYVSIHLPLTPETRGLLSAERLHLVKRTAVLINVARGAIVDEEALVRALQERRIGGAALDVFDGIDVFALPGPPARHPLLDLDNVLLTPHCGGSSVDSSLESKTRGALHAVEVLQGRWPPHVVNADVVPRFTLSKA